LKRKKKENVIESERSEVEREKARRLEGKEAQAAKEAWEKAEADRAAAIKKREKELDKMAKDKIREQLRLDQLNREAEEKKRKGEISAEPPPTQPVTNTPAAATAPPKSYATCTVQIRMPDNSRIQGEFKPDDTIGRVLEYINANRKDVRRPIALSTSYPKVLFTGELIDTLLSDAGLVPRGMLMANYL